MIALNRLLFEIDMSCVLSERGTEPLNYGRTSVVFCLNASVCVCVCMCICVCVCERERVRVRACVLNNNSVNC